MIFYALRVVLYPEPERLGVLQAPRSLADVNVLEKRLITVIAVILLLENFGENS